MTTARLLIALSLSPLLAWAQGEGFAYPPAMRGAKVEVYKTIGDVRLNLYIYNPPSSVPPATRRAAIVFFFGGGWTGGSPAQFEHQCQHLASLGMVAISADYRVFSRHKTNVADAVRDAKSAIRFVRSNAARLGIDPDRIAAGGGSAGGMLAATTGVVAGADEPAERSSGVSSLANAMVLFNPALVLAPVKGDQELTAWVASRLSRPIFAGFDPKTISPFHHIAAGGPPTIILHGKADTTVPYPSVEAFAKKMQSAGNRCELLGFDGQVHGFFNYKASGNKAYDDTLKKAEEFLKSLGYFQPTK